jgi:hypothetical protein
VIRTTSTGGISWARSFGGGNEDYGTCIKLLRDSTVIIGGYSNSFGNGDFNIYTLKIDLQGNIIWSKNFGSAGDEFAYSIESDDQGYFITGKTAGYGAGGFDGFILSLNEDGTNNWLKTYGGMNDELFTSITRTSDRGFFLSGITTSFGAGLQDAYVIKVDSLGNKQWSQIFGGAGTDHASAGEETYDGNFIVTGGTDSYGTGGEAFIVKLDNNGNFIWQNTFGGPGNDCGNDIVEAVDAGYVMIGHSTSFSSNNNNNVYLVKVNQWGNIEYSRSFGDSGSDKGYDIQRTRDFGFVISGELNQKMYLMKLNENGKTSCANYEVSQVGQSAFSAIAATESVSMFTNANIPVFSSTSIIGSGGNVILKCYYNPLISEIDAAFSEIVDTGFVIGNVDDYIEKDTTDHSDRTGNPGASINNIISDLSFEIYPNPGNGSDLSILVNGNHAGNSSITIYDQLGRKQFENRVDLSDTTQSRQEFMLDKKLPAGFYMIHISTERGTRSRTWIVQ